MQIGPLQLLVIGFENDDNFRGQILNELDAVRGRGVIRLIDALFAHKNDAGELTVTELGGETSNEWAEYGDVLRSLLDMKRKGESPTGPSTTSGTGSSGITPAELRAAVNSIPPGKAVAIVLFEHTWATRLSEAVREASGHLLAQGILTRDAVMMVGRELKAIAEAEVVIEAAEAMKGAALLDALVFTDKLQEYEEAAVAERNRTAVAAETLRTLTLAGLIDETEIEPALAELVEAGLLDRQQVDEAVQVAGNIQSEIAEMTAAQTGRYTGS